MAARLPRALAVELMLTGRSFTAAEAHQWGLVNRVVPVDDVLDAARDLARKLCEAAPLSVGATLEIIEATQGLTDQQAFSAVRTDLKVAEQVPHSNDAAEGARAFAEKRAPRWTGN